MSIAFENAAIELPCAFVDYYMPRCKPAVYALIYIYNLRQCIGGAASFSPGEIGKIFQITEADVLNAWEYWENEGLIRLDKKNGAMAVTFLSVETPKSRPELLPAVKKPEAQKGEIKQFVPAGRPQYTSEELTVYKLQSKEIAQLFSIGEQTLGKLLTYHDMNILFGFYDWLRLPSDVIGYLLSYCAENGHRDLRYIEKAAIDWADKQIDDMEKALAYVQTFDKDYREILRAMGQTTGYPTPSQRKYINKWLVEFKMPAELVMDACDRAAVQNGKPTFAYVNKIIEGWNKKGIRTLEEAEAETAEYVQGRIEAAGKEAKPAKNNRFVNFKQRDWDYEKLEKMEREYLAQRAKG